jgi:uncharacterized protein DUF4136
MKATLAVLTLLTLAACSGLSVETVHDQNAQFSQFRTYAWIAGVPARDPAIESQIHDAIDRELPFKGLAKAEDPAAPDLFVSTSVSVEVNRVVQPDQWGYDLGPVGMGSSRVNVLTLPMGTLLVDLVDARTRKLVWRGQASRAVDREISEETIRKAVRKVFRGYPPEPERSQLSAEPPM